MTAEETKYGKEVIGPSDKFDGEPTKPGYSTWIEWGIWYQAPTVDPRNRAHDYEMPQAWEFGLHDCRCGCYMGSSSSSGPVDPFGKCPLKPFREDTGDAKWAVTKSPTVPPWSKKKN